MARSTTTWTKGSSGNNAGRPPRENDIGELFRAIAMEPVSAADKRTRLRALGEELITAGISGDVAAGKAFLDRAYGQPKQRTVTEEPPTTAEAAYLSYLDAHPEERKRFAAHLLSEQDVGRNGHDRS